MRTPADDGGSGKKGHGEYNPARGGTTVLQRWRAAFQTPRTSRKSRGENPTDNFTSDLDATCAKTAKK